MTDTTNDDMVLENEYGREVTVPNALGQELLATGNFKAVNAAAKKDQKEPKTLAVSSLERSNDPKNPAVVTENAKATPAVIIDEKGKVVEPSDDAPKSRTAKSK